MSHYSMNSSSNTGELFKMMFPDSQIAQKFSCGKTKCSYLITHGLVSYSHDRMLASLKDGDVKYVISFDESLNRTQQQAQMDMIICFWDNEKNKVCSRYFDSNFFRPHICSRPPEELTEFTCHTEPNGVNPAFYGLTKYQLETS